MIPDLTRLQTELDSPAEKHDFERLACETLGVSEASYLGYDGALTVYVRAGDNIVVMENDDYGQPYVLKWYPLTQVN